MFFIKTDKVDYDNHIMKDKFTKVVRVEFVMKDMLVKAGYSVCGVFDAGCETRI